MRRPMINGRNRADGPELQNGDIVRILTSPQGKPSRDWLKIAKSSRTRAKIKSWFRQQERQEREEKSRRGRELLEKEASRRNPGVENPLEPISPQLAHIARELGYASLDELVIAVGSGNHLRRASWAASRRRRRRLPSPSRSPRRSRRSSARRPTRKSSSTARRACSSRSRSVAAR